MGQKGERPPRATFRRRSHLVGRPWSEQERSCERGAGATHPGSPRAFPRTRTSAEAEHRRLLAQFAQYGQIVVVASTSATPSAAMCTLRDAVVHYRRAVGPTLKPSTLQGYEES